VPGRHRVLSSSTFEKEARRIYRRDPRMREALVEAVTLLESDPLNPDRRANIRKLANVPAGEGRYRLRIGEYRLRYDVIGSDVFLHSVRLRGQSYR